MIQLREALVSDILTIAAAPSEQTESELRKMGLTPWQATKWFREWIAKGDAVTVVDGETPIAVFGHIKHGDNKDRRLTWFLAAPAYFNLGMRGIRTTRKYLDSVMSWWPGVVFESHSGSDHSATARWFSLLGYRFERHNEMGWPVFVIGPAGQAQSQSA